MIEFYSGTPGSGKSYHAVKRMVQKLRRSSHNTVISNVAMDFSSVKGCKGSFYYVPNDDLRGLSFSLYSFLKCIVMGLGTFMA